MYPFQESAVVRNRGLIPHNIFDLKGAIFDLCVKSYRNKHVKVYVHESEMAESGICATNATASLLGFDIIVYAKIR